MTVSEQVFEVVDRSGVKELEPGQEITDGLAGLYFHTYDGGRLQYQGLVVKMLDCNFYHLVVLFEFWGGEPTHYQIYSLSQMEHWKFYLTHADWIEAWQQYERNQQRDQ